MADSTSVIMGLTTTSNKKTSKSITNVDPNASAGDIKTFVDGLNSITSDTLTSITRVQKTDIEGTYADRTVTIDKDNDENNAVTIDGKNITVNFPQVADTTTYENMTYITITTNVYISSFTLKNTVATDQLQIEQYTNMSIIVAFKPGNNNVNVDLILGESYMNDTKYNPVTINIKGAV